MRELELDGIHDDGEHVLLVDSDGERYTLRIDRALRAAVRSDRPALNMIQAADAAPLRPREIQAMLRSGRSAEDIAEASEIPLEHIRRYEGPVLAEREWTAQRARTFPVGRGGPALLDVVTERLAAREATGETAWDAWRRQDGTWTLELSFSAGGGRARRTGSLISTTARSPVDDEPGDQRRDAPPEPARGRGRLQAVKSSVYDLEADGSLEGGPAPRARTWTPRRPVAEEHPSVIADDDLEALNARRGLRSVPRPDAAATVWSDLDDTDDQATRATGTTRQRSQASATPRPGTGPTAPTGSSPPRRRHEHRTPTGRPRSSQPTTPSPRRRCRGPRGQARGTGLEQTPEKPAEPSGTLPSSPPHTVDLTRCPAGDAPTTPQEDDRETTGTTEQAGPGSGSTPTKDPRRTSGQAPARAASAHRCPAGTRSSSARSTTELAQRRPVGGDGAPRAVRARLGTCRSPGPDVDRRASMPVAQTSVEQHPASAGVGEPWT